MLAGGVGVFAGSRVRAEELHRSLLRVQRAHRIGEQLVVDVAVGVEDEAVVAQPAALGGSAEQVAEVDPSRGELLQDADQAARLVGALVDDERGAVVAGRGRDAVGADKNEAFYARLARRPGEFMRP